MAEFVAPYNGSHGLGSSRRPRVALKWGIQMKLTPKRGLLFAILALASIAPLVMTLRSKPKLQQPVAPGVEVVQVIQKDVPVYREWIGTLDGMVNAEIKAQVTGYLLKQVYTEGSVVTAGQPLFEIDPRPFRAALRSGEGNIGTGGRASRRGQQPTPGSPSASLAFRGQPGKNSA